MKNFSPRHSTNVFISQIIWRCWRSSVEKKKERNPTIHHIFKFLPLRHVCATHDMGFISSGFRLSSVIHCRRCTRIQITHTIVAAKIFPLYFQRRHINEAPPRLDENGMWQKMQFERFFGDIRHPWVQREIFYKTAFRIPWSARQNPQFYFFYFCFGSSISESRKSTTAQPVARSSGTSCKHGQLIVCLPSKFKQKMYIFKWWIAGRTRIGHGWVAKVGQKARGGVLRFLKYIIQQMMSPHTKTLWRTLVVDEIAKLCSWFTSKMFLHATQGMEKCQWMPKKLVRRNGRQNRNRHGAEVRSIFNACTSPCLERIHYNSNTVKMSLRHYYVTIYRSSAASEQTFCVFSIHLCAPKSICVYSYRHDVHVC